MTIHPEPQIAIPDSQIAVSHDSSLVLNYTTCSSYEMQINQNEPVENEDISSQSNVAVDVRKDEEGNFFLIKDFLAPIYLGASSILFGINRQNLNEDYSHFSLFTKYPDHAIYHYKKILVLIVRNTTFIFSVSYIYYI